MPFEDVLRGHRPHIGRLALSGTLAGDGRLPLIGRYAWLPPAQYPGLPVSHQRSRRMPSVMPEAGIYPLHGLLRMSDRHGRGRRDGGLNPARVQAAGGRICWGCRAGPLVPEARLRQSRETREAGVGCAGLRGCTGCRRCRAESGRATRRWVVFSRKRCLPLPRAMVASGARSFRVPSETDPVVGRVVPANSRLPGESCCLSGLPRKRLEFPASCHATLVASWSRRGRLPPPAAVERGGRSSDATPASPPFRATLAPRLVCPKLVRRSSCRLTIGKIGETVCGRDADHRRNIEMSQRSDALHQRPATLCQSTQTHRLRRGPRRIRSRFVRVGNAVVDSMR